VDLKKYGIRGDMENINRNIVVVGAISVGITWVDGALLFKPGSKPSSAWYGICHWSQAIWAFAPIDWQRATMITTIQVSEMVKYCDRSRCCVCFDCPLNNFQKEDYLELFKDVKGFTLGLPLDFGSKPLWFNDPELKYRGKWKEFILRVSGGALVHKDRMQEK